MNEQELLPCPFCGLLNPFVFKPSCNAKTPYDPTDTAYPIVRCRGCYAMVGGDNWDTTCLTAIAKWNSRSNPTAVFKE